MKKITALLLALLFLAAAAGCALFPTPGGTGLLDATPAPGGTQQQETPAQGGSQQPEITPTFNPDAKVLPQIDCSTARIPIVTALYNSFLEKGYTGPEPWSSKTHEAWLNLADKRADTIFLIPPTQDEFEYFKSRKVDIEMKVFGRDGLVFIGNKENPVQNLTSEQIRDIYRGKITNWKQVGGRDAKIDVYIRNPESGSQRLFESLVWAGLQKPDFSGFNDGELYIESQEMGDITFSVLAGENAIGFNIMSYINTEFSNSGLKLFSIDGAPPSTANFASGKYPFLTTSYVAIRADEPENSPARKLFDWIGTPESREIISQNSTLTVSFSDSVVLKTSSMAPKDNAALAQAIEQLDKKPLTRKELYQFSLEEIGFLRNGVFALSGRSFVTAKYSDYFKAQSWYSSTDKTEEQITASFNAFQKQNLELLLAYEKELIRAMPG